MDSLKHRNMKSPDGVGAFFSSRSFVWATRGGCPYGVLPAADLFGLYWRLAPLPFTGRGWKLRSLDFEGCGESWKSVSRCGCGGDGFLSRVPALGICHSLHCGGAGGWEIGKRPALGWGSI